MGKKEDDEIIEQAKSILYDRLYKNNVLVNNPQAVRDYLQLYLAEAQRECFGIISLDSTGCVTGNQILFKGSINECAVYPREVVKNALTKHAVSVVIYHNHPSGSDKISAKDKQITKQLQAALKTVDIKLVDHIIIAGDKTISFAEQGLL